MAPAAGPCAGPGCTKLGTSFCAGCKAVVYCSAACQRAAWKAHKSICAHVASGRGERPSRAMLESELVAKPWPNATPEERDASFDTFEKRYEREVAECARAGAAEHGAGMVVVDISVSSKPLSMSYVARVRLNRKGQPRVSEEIMEMVVDTFARGTSYVVFGVWGPW
ncbi:hypothetical protein T492DRAFT_843059 [Pavlovales sp. CCMP2436]|nr:hypothetical protein T492DRAFT_843059 [Pavlovales sp. CCMP2436]